MVETSRWEAAAIKACSLFEKSGYSTKIGKDHLVLTHGSEKVAVTFNSIENNSMPSIVVVDKGTFKRGIVTKMKLPFYCSSEEYYNYSNKSDDEFLFGYVDEAFYAMRNGVWHDELKNYLTDIISKKELRQVSDTSFYSLSNNGIKPISEKVIVMKKHHTFRTKKEMTQDYIRDMFEKDIAKDGLYKYTILSNNIYFTVREGDVMFHDNVVDVSKKSLIQKSKKGKTLLIGYGSLGSYLLDFLSKSGENIDVFDNDLLSTDNIYRHFLGAPFVGSKKADGGSINYKHLKNINWFAKKYDDQLDCSKYDKILVMAPAHIYEEVRRRFPNKLIISCLIESKGEYTRIVQTNSNINWKDVNHYCPMPSIKYKDKLLGTESLEYSINPIYRAVIKMVEILSDDKVLDGNFLYRINNKTGEEMCYGL